MDREEVLKNTETFVKLELGEEATGHDWWHAVRVRNMALVIARDEGADPFVVELAALLHDLDDWKFSQQGSDRVRVFLQKQGLDRGTVNHICSIIDNISFKGSDVPAAMETMEGKVVQDADRLDALGAIGIARTFAFGGSRGRALHEPDRPPDRHSSFEEYSRCEGPTLNHFYEKLFLLRDRMNTATGMRIASDRHRYMEDFVDRFLKEWDGNDHRTGDNDDRQP